jgi:hypothetical protein
MKHAKFSFAISLLILSLQGCGVSPFPVDAVIADTGTGNSLPEDVVVTAGTLLGVYILTALDTDPTNFTLHKACEVPTGTAVGTTIPCVATIPEGTLHFSKLKLQLVISEGTACDIAVFVPYVYQASTGADFNPEWTETDIDCDGTTDPIPEDCFNGAGVDLIEYPKFGSIYYTPSGGSLEVAYTVDSANARFRHSGNRWTNNTLAVRTANLTTIGGTDGYVANSMQDWSFTCRDKWFDINFRVAITIQDEDTGGPACDPNVYECNQFPNWGSTQSTDPQ